MLKSIYNITIKIIGFFLIAPAVISVFLFISQLIGPSENNGINKFLYSAWIGGNGYTSPLPLYFGLMAIAGAYLLKENNK